VRNDFAGKNEGAEEEEGKVFSCAGNGKRGGVPLNFGEKQGADCGGEKGENCLTPEEEKVVGPEKMRKKTGDGRTKGRRKYICSGRIWVLEGRRFRKGERSEARKGGTLLCCNSWAPGKPSL